MVKGSATTNIIQSIFIANADGSEARRANDYECPAIAAAAGYPPRADSLKAPFALLTDRRSAVTASMLRDVERPGRPEADLVLGGHAGAAGGRRTGTCPCSGWPK